MRVYKNPRISYTEDLTQVAFCEVHNFHMKMTTSVHFCLSYNEILSPPKRTLFQKEKRIVDTDVVNDITRSRQSIITRVDTTLSTE